MGVLSWLVGGRMVDDDRHPGRYVNPEAGDVHRAAGREHYRAWVRGRMKVRK
ncbi:MAG: hypothetical protein IT195_12485 [Microthrixaceae bacterium]|nr:hypothetical protein [Microthrixaceae bacterium]